MWVDEELKREREERVVQLMVNYKSYIKRGETDENECGNTPV